MVDTAAPGKVLTFKIRAEALPGAQARVGVNVRAMELIRPLPRHGGVQNYQSRAVRPGRWEDPRATQNAGSACVLLN